MNPSSRLKAIILGGGRGERLFPLTQRRAKPAVPVGGKYRLIDIPVSNCINSGIKHIYILTQVNTGSLHRHIFQTYKFDAFTSGNIEILPAQQTLEHANWFQGTADAVRSYWHRFSALPASHFLILAGDHLYTMDYEDFFTNHRETDSDITVAALPVPIEQAHQFGILRCDENRRVVEFVEKPQDPGVVDDLIVENEQGQPMVLASMGIYIFGKKVLGEALQFDGVDFGRDILPQSLKTYKTSAYTFSGYWEDVGTIGAFFQANIGMTYPSPKFSFYDVIHPVYTRARFLPGSHVHGGEMKDCIVNEGCRVEAARLKNTILGIRSVVGRNVTMKNVYMMGADFYDSPSNKEGVPVGIGDGADLENVILDKNVRIGEKVHLVNRNEIQRDDGDFYHIRDGVIVIPKNTTVPAGTEI